MAESSASSTPSVAPPRTLDCRIDVEYADRVNFALQQSGVPLLAKVSVTNRCVEAIRGIEVAVSIDNGEAEPWLGRIERLEPENTYSLEPVGFRLSATKLAARTEAERSAIVIKVTAGGALASKSCPIDLLAFDQWPGTGICPEVLAAFVTPNHPSVANILSDARAVLGALSGRDALDGYQSGSRQRVVQIAEACFNAALAREIGYINPPASFDREGQRVRLVDRICRERLGSCLDLSLLLASLWEQAGLHPLVLLLEGHAIPAVWTHEVHLPEPVIDDAARVRNLIELGEIVPVESTLLTQKGAMFAGSVASAKQHMQQPGHGFCAIDIRSGRKRGVRPLPLRDAGSGSTVDLASIDAGSGVAPPNANLERVTLADRAEKVSAKVGSTESGESGGDRIKRWQSRLLDLSLVNRLINFRETGRTIQLRVPAVGTLEDLLAEDEKFALYPKSEGDDQFHTKELHAGHLFTVQSVAETQKRLLILYRTAKATIEETGANPLYLAIGMLKWFETDASEAVRRAPLILLPVGLQRFAAGAGYRYDLRLSDEPIRPNITLLEKLRSEYGMKTDELAYMPEDDRGLDVDLILRNFRSAIREMPRWEVEESVFLGLFSFNKFLMWRDLQENMDRLRKNRLVRHLVEREQTEFDRECLPGPDELDDRVKPGDLLCTRDADSTQLAAVRAASEGRTFVLEGPPGTGKSQTIANIIADSIGHGKRVLFVAEKMAALSVVRDRLEKDGLGAFCLELHSAKASKKEVLAQLEAGRNAAILTEPDDWSSRCEDLTRTQKRLNAYVRAMHERRSTGETLHQVLGRLVHLGDGPRAAIICQDIGSTGRDQLALWRQHVDSLVRQLERIGPVHEHPLRGIGRSEWTFGLPEECRDTLSAASAALEKLDAALGTFLGPTAHVGGVGPIGRDSVEAIAAVASLLSQPTRCDARLITGADVPARISEIRSLCVLGKDRDTKRAALLQQYREEFLELDLLVHLDAVTRALTRPRVLRFLVSMVERRKLRPFCVGSVPALDTLRHDLEAARDVKRATERLATRRDLAEILGVTWDTCAPDWKAVESLLLWCEQLRRAIAVLERDPAASALADHMVAVCCDPAQRDRARSAAYALAGAWKQWSEVWMSVKRLLVTSTERAVSRRPGEGWLTAMRAVVARWLNAIPELNDWCAWRRARDAAAGQGLSELLDKLERGDISWSVLSDVFERSFGEKWFNAVGNSVEVVRDFNAKSHESTIEHFRQLDRAMIVATSRVIAARLTKGRRAATAPSSPQSELGILNRELQKKRRHLPTRRLIEAIPNLLPSLKPCFLMSPLSVAQYLDAKLPPFDLVVFDEASQIPAWDAIGAIARGTEVIIVGDSKQLPPTSFFSTMDDEGDIPAEDQPVEDMESILKECNACGIPAMWLGWHYRSRHESLIAFSNHFYYQNRLHTFPSPAERSGELGVTLRHVADGVYDKGGSRTNRIEAARVVDEVVRLLTATESPDSLGIVTFNQAQQLLIEDLLDQKRREMPQIERFFSSEVPEPVFIKNLENVQGDERDTIIFSVGYGPDQTGRLSMNFGPLNQDGGERRLNVAVTRARRRLIVYSSLRSDQIDLRRTQAVGVKHFKTFLDYADRGPRAIAEAVERLGDSDFESGFEQAVWSALTARGLSVDSQVGCAGYRVDLAIRDPERPGRYLLGVECDGAAYHSAKTARDRDRLRQSVLEGLGWRIERIWSTEWRVNPERCLKRIDQVLAEIRSNQSVSNSAGVASGAAHPTAPDSSPTVSTKAEPGSVPGPGAPEVGGSPAPADSQSATAMPTYRCAAPGRSFTGLDFFDRTTTTDAVDAVIRIIDIEGPIVEELALRRVASWFGVQRITDRCRARFAAILKLALNGGRRRDESGVLWAAARAEAEFAGFRPPGPTAEEQRELDHVPLFERVNAVVHVLETQYGLPREELERQVVTAFGVLRLTARTRELASEAIDAAVASGRAIDNAGRVSIRRGSRDASRSA